MPFRFGVRWPWHFGSRLLKNLHASTKTQKEPLCECIAYFHVLNSTYTHAIWTHYDTQMAWRNNFTDMDQAPKIEVSFLINEETICEFQLALLGKRMT